MYSGLCRLSLRLALLTVGLVLIAPLSRAQEATLNGFITDQATGQPLELVNVTLFAADGTLRGAVTDRDGAYLIARLTPGRYRLRATYMGYAAVRDTLDLAPGEVRTLNLALAPSQEELGEVVVQTERTAGSARVTAGQQTIQPEDLARVPTPDVSGDLASYLTTLPGVVSTGDRGGQLFIRGGEPAQNLVLVDGMVVYQPFHLLGGYSAIPADVIQQTDVYAGGFGSAFGERLSSVIDVATRNGNTRRIAGAAEVSPFLAAARVEGPLRPGRASVLLSGRTALAERAAARYVDAPLPFAFGDAFGKLYTDLGPRRRLSVTALRTFDRGSLGEDTAVRRAETIRWTNTAVGARYVALPRALPATFTLFASWSGLSSTLGSEGEPVRSTSVQAWTAGFTLAFFTPQMDATVGMTARGVTLANELGGLFQNVAATERQTTPFSVHLDPLFKLGGGVRVQPGLRLQVLEARTDPLLEPRLRLSWTRGGHTLSAAGGIYHQEIVGLTDQRDAANVFTAWTVAPRLRVPVVGPFTEELRAGRVPRALHAVLGYRTALARGVDVAVEGYGKRLDDLYIAEWTPFPRFTTRIKPATGRSYGVDVRLEIRRPQLFAAANYGFARTTYEAEQYTVRYWYGDATLRFRPPHDRRHQANILAQVTALGFDLSLRWTFGSGLPFSQAVAFDGFTLIDDIERTVDLPGPQRVIYERPYNALLPAYHRLDLALSRSFRLGRAEAIVQASALNVYDRRNIFYLDVFTLRRVDQLPFVPSLGLKVEVN